MRRTLAALLAGTLLAALIPLTASPANADVVNERWIVYKPTAGGKKYWASYGVYSLTGLHPDRIRPTGRLSLTGGISDVGDPEDDRCTWVLFRITYYDYEQATPKQTGKRYRNCVPYQRASFAFEHEDVSKLEGKVCWADANAVPDRTCVDTYQVIFQTFP
ncbi:hypothetical protein ACFYUK_47615 [Nonomuraea wenchangensis]